jgi:hypothetical protein
MLHSLRYVSPKSCKCARIEEKSPLSRGPSHRVCFIFENIANLNLFSKRLMGKMQTELNKNPMSEFFNPKREGWGRMGLLNFEQA